MIKKKNSIEEPVPDQVKQSPIKVSSKIQTAEGWRRSQLKRRQRKEKKTKD